MSDRGASKQIAALNKELKYLDKEFKLTSKGSKEFENTQEGLKNKLSTLEKKYEANKNKLEVYKQQLEKTKDGIKEKEKELERLNATEGDNTRAIEKTEKQLSSYKEQLANATKSINLTELEMANLADEIRDTNVAFNQFKINEFKADMEDLSKKLDTSSQKWKQTGKNISDVGGKMMTLSAPAIAGGIAIGKMSIDFENAVANINTLLDDTSNLEGYKNKIIELSNETGINTKIMSDGMYQTISSLGDMGKETESMFEIMSKSAKGGGAEVSDAVSLISAGMKGYGSISKDTAQKISDLAFQTAKLGVTTFPEMAKSMQPLFPLSSALNLSMEELFGSMATLTGVTGNTSEVSTQLKAIFSNLLKPTGDMAELIKKYGFENSQAMLKSKGLTGVLQILQKESGGQADKLAKLFSSTEALTGVTALCGANFTDFTTKTGAMNNALGATDKALEKVSSTTGDKFTRAINKFKNSFLESGDKLAPVVDSLSDGISSIADSISKMDAETVVSIVKLAGMTTVMGGVLKGVGTVTQGVGGLMSIGSKAAAKLSKLNTETATLDKVSRITSAGGLSKIVGVVTTANPLIIALGAGLAVAAGTMVAVKTNAELMGKNILNTSDNMGMLEKTIAFLTNTQVKSKEELINLGLVYKDFNKNISNEFKSKVEESAKTLQDFNVYLREINFDNTFSEEESNNFNSKVDSICNGAISTIKENQAESNKEMSNMFKLDDNTIDESEQQVLKFLSKNAETNITKITELKDEIYKIKQKALEEGRTLNDQEIKDIEDKLISIKQLELESLGSNQDEIIYAKADFNARVKNIDLKSASDLMIEKSKIRDDEKIKISAAYDTQIEIMKRKLGEATGEEKTALEEQIKKHEKVRDDKLKVQDDLYKSYLEIIQTNNPNLLAEINKFNGEILTNEDKKNQAQLARLKDTYAGLDGITETGNYSLLNKISGTYANMTVVVDEATGEVIGMHSTMTGEVGAYSTQIANSTTEMSNRFAEALATVKQNLSSCSTATIDAAGRMVGANGEVIGSLQNLKTNADGTKTGILDLNGTPILIQADANNAITNLDNVRNKINSFSGKTFSFNVQATGDIGPVFSKIRGLETGTNYVDNTGMYNVNERGWELFDNSSAYPISSISASGEGQRAILGRGTKVTNHLASTAAMRADITREVARQVDSMNLSGEYYSLKSIKSKQLMNGYTSSEVRQPSVNNNDLISAISSAVLEGFKGIILQANLNAQIDGTALESKIGNGLALNAKRVR